jgi:hypothetical protein
MTAVVSTLQPTSATPAPAPPADTPVSRFDLNLVSVVVVLVLLTQRIGVDVGGTAISLAIPIAWTYVIVSVVRQVLVVGRFRAVLLAAALGACALTTAVVSLQGGPSGLWSVQSLGLLAVIYLPWVLRVRGGQGAAVVARAAVTFVRTMVGLALVGIGQLAAQLSGVWEWTDYVQDVLPAAMYIREYNYDNELAYDLSIFKSTAFVLLEPSFLSQYCALAVIIGILLRVRAWQLLVLVGGLASAVSGTGLVLLAVGGVLLLLRAPRTLRPVHVVVGALAPVVVFFNPVGSFLLARQGELGIAGTSGNARFVAPYQAAWRGLNADPDRFLIGAGPGSVDRVIPGRQIGFNGTDILYSIIPKLVFEYGVIAGGLMILFLVLATLDRAPWRVVPAALVVMTFVLSGALLQPQTAVLVWLLAGLGAGASRPLGIHPPAASGPLRRWTAR